MKRTLSSALVFSVLALPVVGLVGCSDKAATTEKETVTTPEGTTTTTTEKEVKSTGENPPPNSAGETANTPK
jgi:hypothetical protein